MKFLAFVIVALSFHVHASELKPGLWEIKMKMFQNGKEFDPMAEVMKQLEKLPEEQRKMILSQMKASGKEAGSTQICYTKEMLKEPTKLAEDEDSECDYKEQSKSPKRVVATFKCKDGTTGTSVWELKDANNMQVKMDAKRKDGTQSKMEYSAKFLKSDCK